MKIAVFHNIETGGAKRAVYEHAKGLRERGHTLHLFTPTQHADSAFLPLAPLCETVFTYDDLLTAPQTAPKNDGGVSEAASTLGGDESRVRQAVRRVLGDGLYETARDTIWVRKQEQRRAQITRAYERMTSDLLAGGYDVVYAHQCEITLAPPFLPALRNCLPVVFYCQDTLRRFSEWPADTNLIAPDYDARPVSSVLRRKRWGRVVSPVLAAFQEREKERFAHNLRAAPVVLVNSLYSREAIVKETGVLARVNYLGVDGDFFCPAQTESDAPAQTENEVLSLGAVRKEKRHDFVIAAVAAIPEESRPSVRIVGYDLPGNGRRLTDALRSQAQTQNVRLTIDREVTDETVRDAYRCARVFAFAGRLEPFGLVVLEALACGTPVVVSNEGGPREIVKHGVTGFAADASDAGAFGAAIARVANDATLRSAMARAGRADVVQNWTWARSCDEVNALLQTAVRRS